MWDRWGTQQPSMMQRTLDAVKKVEAQGGYYRSPVNVAFTASNVALEPGRLVVPKRIAGELPTKLAVPRPWQRGIRDLRVSARDQDRCRDVHQFVFPQFLHLPANLFHLFADNLLPIAQAVVEACDSALHCPNAELVLLDRPSVVSNSRGTSEGALAWLFEVIDAIFQNIVSLAHPPAGCVKTLTFGKFPSAAYFDDTNKGSALVAALRGLLDERFGYRDTPHTKPLVVRVDRYPRDLLDQRFLAASTAARIREAFDALGARHIDCCNFSAAGRRRVEHMWHLLRQADIVYMLHGAGQVNAVFANDRAVVVEFYGPKGWESVTCRRFASYVRGGYVRAPLRQLPLPRRGHRVLDPKQARVVAACALAVWRAKHVDRACFADRAPDRTFYITEAWSAHDNRLLRAPPQSNATDWHSPPVGRKRMRPRGRRHDHRLRHTSAIL